VRCATVGLRQPTHTAADLARELRRLLVPLIQAHSAPDDQQSHADVAEGLWVVLGDLVPSVPDQAAFWRLREQRLATAQGIAETLTRRHGRPLLVRLDRIQPAAIFDEEGYRLIAASAAASAQIAQGRRSPLTGHPRMLPADPWQSVPQRLHWW
jgi:hypothetical protein